MALSSHGIIYQAHSSLKKFTYRVIRSFGAGIFSFAIIALIFSFYPIVKEEFFTKPQKIGFGDLIERTSASDRGLDPYFSIYIPKMNAKANIIPNVDPSNQKQYLDALTNGVAHAKGTGFPNQNKLIYLFSHSTDSPLNFARFNAVFYLLKKLEKGDRIMIYFMDRQYQYIVTDSVIASETDTSWLVDKNQGEYLILQTCDPPGTSLRRLLVVAKPI